MNAVATQRKLILPGERVYCPMTSVAGARDRIPGTDEDDVLAMIEESGDLPWAWDIALGTGRRELRILTACIEHYARTGRALDWDWSRVREEVFRGFDKPFLTGTRVRLILNCGSTHVMNLVTSRPPLLKKLPGTTWNTGPNGSPVITRESFEQFLRTRALNALEVA